MKFSLRYALLLLTLTWMGRLPHLVAQETQAPALTIPYGNKFNAGIALSPGGRTLLAFGGGGPTTLFHAVTGDSLRTIEGIDGLAYAAAWSPNGERVLVAAIKGAAIVNTETWEIEREFGIDSALHFSSAIWSGDGSMIAFGDLDSTVRVWDATTGALRYRRRFDSYIHDLEFTSGDTRMLVTVDNGTFHLWDLGVDALDLSVTADWEAIGFWNVFGAINPQGTIIATASTGAYLTGEIKLWDAVTGDSIGLLEGHSRVPVNLVFTSDGSHLLTAGFDTTMRLWRIADRTNTVVFRGHEGIITELDVGSDDRTIATIADDGSVRVWSLDISAVPSEPVAGEWTMRIGQAIPNPARDRVAIDLAMARPGNVSVALVNALGQVVIDIPVERFAVGGEQRLVFDVGELPVGAYHCVVSAGVERVVTELQIVR